MRQAVGARGKRRGESDVDTESETEEEEIDATSEPDLPDNNEEDDDDPMVCCIHQHTLPCSMMCARMTVLYDDVCAR